MSIPVGSSNMMQQAPAAPETPINVAIVEHLQQAQRAGRGGGSEPNGYEYTLCCDNCLRPFPATNSPNSGMQRTSVEYDALRRELLISDPNWRPVMCDDCFHQATVPAAQRRLGYPNLVLEKLSP